jgi:N-acyl-D-amino-acid deacylase
MPVAGRSCEPDEVALKDNFNGARYKVFGYELKLSGKREELHVPDFDLVIKGCLVVDGTGELGRKADVGIVGDSIEAVGPLGDVSCKSVIDGTGKVLSPGFIDTHSHSDLLVLAEPAIAPKIMQGITTEVIGQDGMSLAPVKQEYIPAWKKSMAGLEGDYPIDWDWRTVKEYLDRIDSMDLGPNIVFLAPHGNIRLCVMGLDNRAPADDEMRQMENLLDKCLAEGARGMSTGIIYPPCCYADTGEFVNFGHVLKANGVPMVLHQRNESDKILESVEEVLTIARESGCHVHFSHLKVAGSRNWHKVDAVIDKLDRSGEMGLDVSFDQYPYTAGSTMLAVILPPWAHEGGSEQLLERLKDPKLRDKMKKDILDGIPGWDNHVRASGLDNIFITFVKTGRNQGAIGKSLTELGDMTGKHPLDAAFDLLVEEENTVGSVRFYGREEDIIRIMKHPFHNVCTDGIMGDKPHPRLYGTCPRILGRYVRGKQELSLETAIYKMTGKPAGVLGIKDRGYIKPGFKADIVVFDPDTIIDTGDYENPISYPIGIDYVLVNGKIAVSQGRIGSGRAGRVLR